MRIGIWCGGIGDSANPEWMRVAAQTAENSGFSSLWLGEHTVLFDSYPLSRSHSKNEDEKKGGFEGDAAIPVPTTPIVDPLTTLAWLAAQTRSIELGTSIVILPQHNPVILAKSTATLDLLSNGRVALGVGMGWSVEEYQACGVPWSGRGRRMDEYILALRSLWGEGASTFEGETVNFTNAYSFPKPVQRHVPIVMGGESEAMMRRIARYGDGWLAFNMPTDEAPKAVRKLHDWTRENGRDPSALRLIVAVFNGTTADDMCRYRDAGFTEFYLIAANDISADVAALPADIDRFADRFVNVAAKL